MQNQREEKKANKKAREKKIADKQGRQKRSQKDSSKRMQRKIGDEEKKRELSLTSEPGASRNKCKCSALDATSAAGIAKEALNRTKKCSTKIKKKFVFFFKKYETNR